MMSCHKRNRIHITSCFW